MSVSLPVVRGVHRRLALPPPAARSSLAVWRELADADEDLAWALFMVTRRVRAVADGSAPARWKRADDVRAAAAGAPEIAADLLLLGARQLSLAGARRGRAAGACNRLAAWAAEQGFGEVAVQLAEAAVALQPGNSRRTYEAGRLNRMFGNLDSAELLYSRAICLARPGKHWWVYVRAHLGMGHVCKHRGQLDRAAAHHSTAARHARDRSGEKWLAAMIEHDLFALAAENRDFDAAVRHAQRACEWMPVHHERVPALVHDFAFLLLEMQAPQHAMRLLDELVRKRLPSAEMVLLWSTYARTAGVLRDPAGFRTGEREVGSLVTRFGAFAAPAFINLAIGAYHLDSTNDAQRYVERGVELGRAGDDRSVVAAAETLLSALESGGLAPAAELLHPATDVVRLAERLESRLSEWRGPTWKRKQQANAAALGKV